MNNKFEFSYSAPTEQERKEIEYIKNQYETHNNNNSKLNRLRKLDKKVNNIPTCIALVFGIIGMLVFGLGLTMVLEWNLMVLGILIGIIGAGLMLVAYFSYRIVYKKLKEKYSNEIINLSKELLNEE